MTICKVCGSGFIQDSVLCAACETPHHEECFLYSHGCSVYACGSPKYKVALYNNGGKFIGLETKDITAKSLTDILRPEMPLRHEEQLITSFLHGYTVYRIHHHAPHPYAVDHATDALHIPDDWTRSLCRWAATEWGKVIGVDGWENFSVTNQEKQQFTSLVTKYAHELRKHMPGSYSKGNK